MCGDPYSLVLLTSRSRGLQTKIDEKSRDSWRISTLELTTYGHGKQYPYTVPPPASNDSSLPALQHRLLDFDCPPLLELNPAQAFVMSQQYRSSQHQQVRVKKKEEDPADFMRLVRLNHASPMPFTDCRRSLRKKSHRVSAKWAFPSRSLTYRNLTRKSYKWCSSILGN